MMKIIAIYLPQFHRIPENDLWWGEGFTEWTVVKKAEQFFDGHCQPRVPLHNNYYDLLDKGTMEWQAGLMHKYNIYGMAFYHYWFKDGKQILEKPAENLLRWKEIDMPFCFSWANEPWSRTWSKLSEKNVWASKFEPLEDLNTSNGMLLEQKYGEENEWKNHFDYLKKFFVDERYIKVDGKPVFIIYRPNSIPCLTRMIECWREMAMLSDFPGIYVIGVNTEKMGILDATLLQEPQYSIGGLAGKKIIDGRELWELVLSKKVYGNTKTYLCGFSGYDDTPRRGEGGRIVLPVKPDEFKKFMTKILAKSSAMGNEFTFINAWNEWGEGMYLEPDEKNGFGMLEAIKQALDEYPKEKCVAPTVSRSDNLTGRYYSYWHVLNRWLSFIEKGGLLYENLEKRGYKNIALYGIGMLGLHVVIELENSPVNIVYGIDQRGNDVKQRFPIFRKEDKLPDVDAIVVSVIYEFGNIYNFLKKKVNCPIVSLEEIIEEDF